MKYILLALSIALAAECYTTQDMKTHTCNALCRRDEYQFGYYELQSDSCVCANRFKFKEMNKRALTVRGMSPETW